MAAIDIDINQREHNGDDLTSDQVDTKSELFRKKWK